MAQITEGHYRAVVESPEIAVSAKKDTPCIKATVRITEDGPHKGMRLPWEGWLTDSAGKRTIQSMIFAGCKFPPKPGEDEPDLENFEGCGSVEIEAVISLEEYTPEPTDSNPNPKTSRRPRVEFINPIGQSRATKSIDSNQKKMIASQFGGLVKQVRKESEDRKGKKDDPTSFNPTELDAQNASADEEGKKKLY